MQAFEGVTCGLRSGSYIFMLYKVLFKMHYGFSVHYDCSCCQRITSLVFSHFPFFIINRSNYLDCRDFIFDPCGSSNYL